MESEFQLQIHLCLYTHTHTHTYSLEVTLYSILVFFCIKQNLNTLKHRGSGIESSTCLIVLAFKIFPILILGMLNLHVNTAKCLHIFIICAHTSLKQFPQKMVLNNNCMFRDLTEEKMIRSLILLSPHMSLPAAAIRVRAPNMKDPLLLDPETTKLK